MEFASDPKKSDANRAKHGIDFAAAEALWEDVNRIEVPARTVRGEARWTVIGRIGRVHWSAVITYRDEKIRIISVRRSRAQEIAGYPRA